MSFIELRQTGDNDWKGKYQGNYGVYTVKVTLEGEKAVKYSCSCPSDYHPCKHISFIEAAIAKQTAAKEKHNKNGGLRLEDLIKTVSAEKLREFIIAQAKYNEELLNAVLVEFAANAENTKGNKYSGLIQKALATVPVGTDNYYYDEEPQDIDVLDQWLEKARDCVRQKQYNEAILICKACIEEYSQWLYNTDEDDCYYSDEYQSIPFDIMEQAAEHIDDADKKKLFKFCLSELKKKRYEKTDFYDSFQKLLAGLALKIDPDAFIALQDELLAEVTDKSSREAEIILQRKINFYRRLHKPNKAWALIEENIQITSFRQELVEKKIKEQNFSEAKILINDFITKQNGENNRYIDKTWYKMLLDIAQKEKDIASIKEFSYRFIKDRFDNEYYAIYKAAFCSGEWAGEMEKLFSQYADGKYFCSSAADLLAAENETERLLHYIEKHFSVENIENYYKVFVSEYPEKTLELFRRGLVFYAENNLGRYHYEYIASLLRKMSKINGGKKAVSELVAGFRAKYKNRRAMMEILGKFR